MWSCSQEDERVNEYEYDGSKGADIDPADEARRPRVSLAHFNSDSGETPIVPVWSAVGEITFVINATSVFAGALERSPVVLESGVSWFLLPFLPKA